MASRARPRRGGGPRRGPPRGGMRGRGYGRRPPPPREFQEIDQLGKEEVECDSKTIVIEFNSNEQGQFMKISEADARGRSRIILNMESASTMKSRLNDFLKDIDSFKDGATEGETERLATGEPFNQGRRRYFVDVRQNARGKFVKLTMQSGGKVYVAFPLENLADFLEKYTKLYDTHYSPRDDESPAPASPTNNLPSLPSSREVRAGGKSFYFDVDRNDRGTYVRLTEVVRAYNRRTHINIPNSCWPQMAEVFTQLGQELPYEEGSPGSNSGSEDN